MNLFPVTRRRVGSAGVLAVLALVLATGASDCSGKDEATKRDEQLSAAQLDQFQRAQPVPRFTSSQLRQNLIEIETAQANATVTTSFMFLMAGSGSTGPLVHSCPSIGFPIPATYQLTNPQQGINGDGGIGYALPQIEATGVYTGDTTGTYVMCIGADGKPFAFYHEGFVATVTGPAHWDNAKGEIVMDGTSSAEFTGAD